MGDSVFQRSALASGLVTEGDLAEARATLRAEANGNSSSIDDQQLATQLIAMGRINSWQAHQLAAGRRNFKLGPYQIIDSLGRGSTGDVFLAEHSVMGRLVAIKVLPKHKSTPTAIAHFINEIRSQAQLDHRNLVRAYDAGHDLNVHFLVMEYVPGTDLRHLVRRQGKLDMSDAANLFIQAAEGLAHAHQRGLTHGYIKPTNVLINEERLVKLSDLGLASFFSDAATVHAGLETLPGSADYIAPEQLQSPGQCTPLTDIYALGCTLYYAVTGKVPFPGGTAAEKAEAHLNQLPRHPRLRNPSLSDEFVDIIADMMAKDPHERIATAEEVATRLRG